MSKKKVKLSVEEKQTKNLKNIEEINKKKTVGQILNFKERNILKIVEKKNKQVERFANKIKEGIIKGGIPRKFFETK